jgi:hypothetical protein
MESRVQSAERLTSPRGAARTTRHRCRRVVNHLPVVVEAQRN